MHTQLRRLRKTGGLTLSQVADMLDMSESQVSRLERGESDFTGATLEKFARLYSCTVADILTDGPPLERVVVRGDVQGGAWREAIEWNEDDWYTVAVPRDERYPNLPRFGLEVRGASMNQVFPEGTVLICILTEAIQDGVPPGKKVIVQQVDRAGLTEATVKELLVDEQGRAWLWPRSTDPEYQAPLQFDQEKAEDVKITAVVTGSYREE